MFVRWLNICIVVCWVVLFMVVRKWINILILFLNRVFMLWWKWWLIVKNIVMFLGKILFFMSVILFLVVYKCVLFGLVFCGKILVNGWIRKLFFVLWNWVRFWLFVLSWKLFIVVIKGLFVNGNKLKFLSWCLFMIRLWLKMLFGLFIVRCLSGIWNFILLILSLLFWKVSLVIMKLMLRNLLKV